MKNHTFCPVGTNMRLRIDYMPLINPKTAEINQECVCKRKREREGEEDRGAHSVLITQKQPPEKFFKSYCS